MITKKELLEENKKLKFLLAETIQENKTSFTCSDQIASKHMSHFAGLRLNNLEFYF